jgi:hypothetical protein
MPPHQACVNICSILLVSERCHSPSADIDILDRIGQGAPVNHCTNACQPLARDVARREKVVSKIRRGSAPLTIRFLIGHAGSHAGDHRKRISEHALPSIAAHEGAGRDERAFQRGDMLRFNWNDTETRSAG